MIYKKILIIGNCGAGKSTLARALNEKTKIPIYHLDKYYWEKNWKRVPLIKIGYVPQYVAFLCF